MSRYLEEAASILRKADKTTEAYQFDRRMQIARQFAELAAIEDGQLPASIVGLVLNQITGGTE